MSKLARCRTSSVLAVAAIIPWLIVIIPRLWFLIKAVRRFRERQRAAKAATPDA